MSGIRKRHSPQFKAKVAIDAVRGVKTPSELASTHGVHPAQVTQWKKTLIEQSPGLFSDGRAQRRERGEEIEREQLYEDIGRLKVKLDWLKKKSGVSD